MCKGNGFTLIELLIVLAILGILVGIVAMSIGDLETTAESCTRALPKQVAQTVMNTQGYAEMMFGGNTSALARATAILAATC